ncbi:MAG: hypothetical protein L6Q99_14075 [Planctomycetes bacterium]|nr:hypothetical protein [Planctomycetota bacterium]
MKSVRTALWTSIVCGAFVASGCGRYAPTKSARSSTPASSPAAPNAETPVAGTSNAATSNAAASAVAASAVASSAAASSAAERVEADAAVESYGEPDDEAAVAALARSAKPRPSFGFDLPDGWRVRAVSPKELAAFYVRGNPRLACRLTELAGDGGGLAALVDGWRREFALEASGDDEPLDWPAARLCGREARIVDLEAPAERGTERKSRVALVAIGAADTWVFELCGPTDLVRLERGAFFALARSLVRLEAH